MPSRSFTGPTMRNRKPLISTIMGFVHRRDDLLRKLAQVSPREAQVIEMRFFASAPLSWPPDINEFVETERQPCQIVYARRSRRTAPAERLRFACGQGSESGRHRRRRTSLCLAAGGFAGILGSVNRVDSKWLLPTDPIG